MAEEIKCLLGIASFSSTRSTVLLFPAGTKPLFSPSLCITRRRAWSFKSATGDKVIGDNHDPLVSSVDHLCDDVLNEKKGRGFMPAD